MNNACPSQCGLPRRRFKASCWHPVIGTVIACCAAEVSQGADVKAASALKSGASMNQVFSSPSAPLSRAESDSLQFMREEEQLAHDVYAISATLWPQTPFSNITDSEDRHSAAVKRLLDRYKLADPLAGLSPGHFKTPAFQSLHDTLVTASRVSLVDALKVGAEIEELDIHDLDTQKTDIQQADILMVYDNLLRGSRNHLRAFIRMLTQQGKTYTPKHITQAQFDAIVSTGVERGNNMRAP
jgi:hypothetical protein